MVSGVTTGSEHGTGLKASNPGGGPGGVKVGESRIDLLLVSQVLLVMGEI